MLFTAFQIGPPGHCYKIQNDILHKAGEASGPESIFPRCPVLIDPQHDSPKPYFSNKCPELLVQGLRLQIKICDRVLPLLEGK